MKLIVDASVAVKWLFTEDGTDESRRLLAHRIRLYAPDFILTEAANVVWKKARRGDINDPQPYFEELTSFQDVIALRSSQDIVAHASAIAIAIDHPVYDCLYLACAQAEGAPLVTADTKLQRAASTISTIRVWHILDAHVGERIAAGATALVIDDATIRQAIAAYDAFRQTKDTVTSTLRPDSSLKISTPKHQRAYLATPAFLRLVNFLADLPYDERVDLIALGWYGRRAEGGSGWTDMLENAYRMRINDLRYEAGLAGHWRAGLDRLRSESRGALDL